MCRVSAEAWNVQAEARNVHAPPCTCRVSAEARNVQAPPVRVEYRLRRIGVDADASHGVSQV